MDNSSVISVPEGCVTTQFFPFLPWDNPDNIVPKEVDNIFNLVFAGICLPLLFVISFVTNIINMVVFYKHGLKERINACLFSLSVLDLLSITVLFSCGSDVLYTFIIGRESDVGPSMQFFFRYYLIGLHGFSVSSQLVYAVITLERCLCVTRPLLARRLMPTKTTVVVLWAMVLVITGESVFVMGVQYSVLCVLDPTDGSVSYINYPRDLYFRNRFVIDVVYSVVNGYFVPGVSFICVAVCTLITAVKLKELSRWRETVSSSSVSSRDSALTRVIIGTSILFIVCSIPSLVICSCSLVVPDLNVGGRYDNLAWVIRRFYQLSTAINTFNFFIYYGCGSKFRETTRGLFACCHRGGSTSDKNKPFVK